MDENDRLQSQVERFNRNNPDVPDLVAEVKRLTAERAAVRAALVDSGTEPVTEDMGRLAALVAAQLADEVATIARLDQEIGRLQSALGSEIAARQAAEAEVERLRADLATARRLLPPRYVAADGSILDPERCTPHAPDCAECGRGRAHDEGCLALFATPAEEVAGLRDRVERLTADSRLTLSHVAVLEVSPPTPDQPLPIRVERVQQLNGAVLWAARQGAFVLARDGRWEREPLPSSRSAAFLTRCRFSTLGDAWSAATDAAEAERLQALEASTPPASPE